MKGGLKINNISFRQTGEKTGEPIDKLAEKTGEPSQKEVRAYCDELGSNVDPMKFYDYYAERNWKIAGEPINDWKAVFRSWHKREFRRKPKSYLSCRYEDDSATAEGVEASTHDDQEHLDKILAKLKKLGQQNAK